MKKYVSIDIGGTTMKYGLIGEDGVILCCGQRDTEAYKGGPSILEKAAEIVEDYQKTARISGICISTAGMVDTEKGEIRYAAPLIPDYTGTRFKAVLEDRFQVSCEVENDVNCAGLAEAVSGAARGSRVALMLTVGTGIGGCLILDGHVFHGASGSACEVGYMHMDGSDFQTLGAASILTEKVTSRKEALREETAQCAEAREDAAEAEHPRETAEAEHSQEMAEAESLWKTAEQDGKSRESWDGYHIFEAAGKGDPVCIRAIDEMVDVLGKGIANLCYVINPEVVVLGGGIMAQEAYLKERVEAAVERWLLPAVASHTRIAFAEHRNSAGMLGAFYHFKQRRRDEICR